MTVSWLSHECLMTVSWRKLIYLGFGGPWVSAVWALVLTIFFFTAMHQALLIFVFFVLGFRKIFNYFNWQKGIKKKIKCLYITLLNYIHFLLLGDLKPGGASSRKPTKDSEVFFKSLLRKLNKSICISSTKYWPTMQKNPPLCHIGTNYYCLSYIHIPSSFLSSSSLTCFSLPYLSRSLSMTSSPCLPPPYPPPPCPRSSSLPSSPCPPTPTILLSLSSWFQRKSICFNMIHI